MAKQSGALRKPRQKRTRQPKPQANVETSAAEAAQVLASAVPALSRADVDPVVMAAHVTAKGVLKQSIMTTLGAVVNTAMTMVGVVFAAYVTGVMSGKNEQSKDQESKAQPTVTVTTARTVLKTPPPRPRPTVTKTVYITGPVSQPQRKSSPPKPSSSPRPSPQPEGDCFPVNGRTC